MIENGGKHTLQQGGRFFRLFLFLVLWQPVSAQVTVHYSSDNIVLNYTEKTIEGNVSITLVNAGDSIIESIELVHWPFAYQQGKKTYLEEELLLDQNAKLHFAKPKKRGFAQLFCGPQSSEKAIFRIPVSAEVQKLDVNLPPGEQTTLTYLFNIQLPESSFNGYGFDYNSIRLSQWLPRLVPPGTPFHEITLNNRHREAYFVPATYNLLISYPGDVSLASNLKQEITQTDNIPLKTTLLSALSPEYDALIVAQQNGIVMDVPNTAPAAILHLGQARPTFKTDESWNRIIAFLKKELNYQPAARYNLVFLEDKNGLQSAGACILLDKWQNQDDLEGELIEELVLVFAREQMGVNPATNPHLTIGLANYYKHLFFKQFYPNKMLLGPLAKTFVARFFDVDHYPISYQNRMLYLYMARQGLDQPLNDEAKDFSRFNREAVLKGKSALWYSYLRIYVGEKNFLRGMQRWSETSDGSPESLVNAMKYYHNQNLDWLLADLYTTTKKLDYKLVKTENCTSVYTATVRNKGNLAVPFSITGFKGDAPVLTEWKDGFTKKKTVQIHLEDYTSVEIDADGAMPETKQKNNEVRTSGIFRGTKPLKMQFYTSFENPDRTQIFWLPSLNYNAYDQFLLGAQFTNANLFKKPIEWKIAPVLSTGTGTLTGNASLRFNFVPYAGPAHLITFGMYGRYYHYAPDLAYTRFSPTLTFNMRKSHPRSEWINTLRLRGVNVDREAPNPETDGDIDIEGPLDYRILDLRWRSEKGSILSPIIFNADAQLADDFGKLSIEYLQRWRLTRNHLLTARIFGGAIIGETPDPYFLFGLSGTTDYLFDYAFIGRSDQTGIWSQQMFLTDGGFKSQTDAFARSILAANVNVPFYRFIGAFGDFAIANGGNTSYEYWDYGLYIEFIPDFLEIYFPFQNSQQMLITEPNYYKQIRFVLNIELDAVMNRVRRGWY